MNKKSLILIILFLLILPLSVQAFNTQEPIRGNLASNTAQSCNNDIDCPLSQSCKRVRCINGENCTYECQGGQQCNTHQDCPEAGATCNRGFCEYSTYRAREGSNEVCNTRAGHNQCPDEEVCLQTAESQRGNLFPGRCREVVCFRNDECLTNSYCILNKCRKYCLTDANCPTGKICENRQCLDAECSQNSQCGQGQTCYNQRCISGINGSCPGFTSGSSRVSCGCSTSGNFCKTPSIFGCTDPKTPQLECQDGYVCQENSRGEGTCVIPEGTSTTQTSERSNNRIDSLVTSQINTVDDITYNSDRNIIAIVASTGADRDIDDILFFDVSNPREPRFRGQILDVISSGNGAIRDIEFSKDGNTFIIIRFDTGFNDVRDMIFFNIRSLDNPTRINPRSLQITNQGLIQADISNNGRFIAAVSREERNPREGKITILDLNSKIILAEHANRGFDPRPSQNDGMERIEFNYNDQLLVSVSIQGNLFFIDPTNITNSNQINRIFQGPSIGADSVYSRTPMHPSKNLMATAREDEVKFWDLSDLTNPRIISSYKLNIQNAIVGIDFVGENNLAIIYLSREGGVRTVSNLIIIDISNIVTQTNSGLVWPANTIPETPQQQETNNNTRNNDENNLRIIENDPNQCNTNNDCTNGKICITTSNGMKCVGTLERYPCGNIEDETSCSSDGTTCINPIGTNINCGIGRNCEATQDGNYYCVPTQIRRETPQESIQRGSNPFNRIMEGIHEMFR
ncbi:WD40 repeat domain-containing protein [Candidatus Woesearchaeota archaeon]|nr:WD40 repeat domain-containing protein [Candidatus Woesearchaeota archaeon]